MEKLTSFKLNKCYVAKDITKKVKGEPTDQEKVFVSHYSDKGVVSRIYKEFL